MGERAFDIKKIQFESPEQNIEKTLTGEYIQGLGPNSDIPPNMVTEGGEYVQFPEGDTQEIVGPKHSQGGTPLSAPDGTRVLSDKTELTSKQIKTLNREYELKLKSGDTYATAVEAYTKKIGLTRLNKEQETLFGELSDVLKSGASEGTMNVNKEYLSGKISDIEQKKASKLSARSIFFDVVYDMQESSKPKSEQTQNTFEQGGEKMSAFHKICEKYGMTPEEGKKYMESKGLPVYATGGENSDDIPPELKVYFNVPILEYLEKLKKGEIPAEVDKVVTPARSAEIKAKVGNNPYSGFSIMGGANRGVTAKSTPAQSTSNSSETPTQEATAVNKNVALSKNILVDAKNVYTGASLNDAGKSNLLAFYSKVHPQTAEALRNGTIKWDNIALNKGLVEDLESKGGADNIQTGRQATDKTRSGYFDNLPTYGDINDPRSQGFVLKDYYESTTGKDFKYITEDELSKVQQDYADAIQNRRGAGYMSGIKAPSDGKFGNVTSGMYRDVEQVQGTKAGTIDVDKLLLNSDEEINLQLKDYGVTADQLKGFKNAAVKYVDILPPTAPATEAPKSEVPAKEEEPVIKRGPLGDNVRVPKVTGPKMLYTPDQSIMPPSPLQANLLVESRFGRIDPLRIGVENNLQELSDQRQFVAGQLESLPSSARAGALASLLATSQEGANKAITQANITNAQNASSAELFNIAQQDKENIASGQNALNYEARTMTALAKQEEAERDYLDYNKRIALADFQNQQKLNILNSLFPDFDINYMQNGFDFDPNVPYDPKQTLNMYRMMNGLDPIQYSDDETTVTTTDKDGNVIKTTKTKKN